jgi:hypothetical protein
VGGRGSGRRHQGGSATTDDTSSVDIRWLHRTQDISDPIRRTITMSRCGVTHTTVAIEKTTQGLLFSYEFREYRCEPVQVARVVSLLWSDTPFGGRRPWFCCPQCKRRTAIVFISRSVGCRKCFGIRHQSQNECASDRAIRRIDFLREKLKWQPGFLNGAQWRPKGMHHKTYDRHLREYLWLSGYVNVSIAQRFGFAARELGFDGFDNA